MLTYSVEGKSCFSLEKLDEILSLAIDYYGLVQHRHLNLRFEDVRMYAGWLDYCEEDISAYDLAIKLGMSEEQTVLTIFHEMCHLKQSLDGKLEWKDFGVYIWNGVEYCIDDFIGLDYREIPWEKEAYRHEKILYELYKNGVKGKLIE